MQEGPPEEQISTAFEGHVPEGRYWFEQNLRASKGASRRRKSIRRRVDSV